MGQKYIESIAGAGDDAKLDVDYNLDLDEHHLEVWRHTEIDGTYYTLRPRQDHVTGTKIDPHAFEQPTA